MQKLTPNLMVKNVKKSIEFYTQILGFKLIIAINEDKKISHLNDDKKIIFASVEHNQVNFMFQEELSLKNEIVAFNKHEISASVTFYIKVENIEKYFLQIKDKVQIIKELNTTFYGMKEFYIKDNSGYILCFAQEKR